MFWRPQDCIQENYFFIIQFIYFLCQYHILFSFFNYFLCELFLVFPFPAGRCSRKASYGCCRNMPDADYPFWQPVSVNMPPGLAQEPQAGHESYGIPQISHVVPGYFDFKNVSSLRRKPPPLHSLPAERQDQRPCRSAVTPWRPPCRSGGQG